MFDSLPLIWLKHCVVIYFMTFLHEDAAILAAAFSCVEHGMPLVYAYSSIFLGIISGDVDFLKAAKRQNKLIDSYPPAG